MEFTTDELIDDFNAIQTRRAKFKWNMLVPLTIYDLCLSLYFPSSQNCHNMHN